MVGFVGDYLAAFLQRESLGILAFRNLDILLLVDDVGSVTAVHHLEVGFLVKSLEHLLGLGLAVLLDDLDSLLIWFSFSLDEMGTLYAVVA